MIAGGALLLHGQRASAGIDLTGSWDFKFDGDLMGDCDLDVVQTADEVTGTFVCPGQATGDFEGTVTPGQMGATLDIDLTIDPEGLPPAEADAIGEVAPGGNSFDGTWSGPFGTEGTFEGTRLTGPPTPGPTPPPDETPTPSPTATPFPFVKGDIDCDGDIDAVDALKLLQSVAGLPFVQQPGCPEVGSGDPPFGDMDCDGDVDAADALAILRFLAGLPANLPGGCSQIGEEALHEARSELGVE